MVRNSIVIFRSFLFTFISVLIGLWIWSSSSTNREFSLKNQPSVILNKNSSTGTHPAELLWFPGRTEPLISSWDPKVNLNSIVSTVPRLAQAETPGLIVELISFKEKRRSELLSNPGKIHRMIRYSQNLSGIKVNYQVEGWYSIDKNGNLIEAVENLKDDQENLLQTRQYQAEKRLIHDTLPVIFRQDAPNLFGLESLDFGFSDLAIDWVAEGSQLNRQTIYENCWYMGEQYMVGKGNLRITALYNPDTGKVRKLEAIQITPKGLSFEWSIELVIEELMPR